MLAGYLVGWWSVAVTGCLWTCVLLFPFSLQCFYGIRAVHLWLHRFTALDFLNILDGLFTSVFHKPLNKIRLLATVCRPPLYLMYGCSSCRFSVTMVNGGSCLVNSLSIAWSDLEDILLVRPWGLVWKQPLLVHECQQLFCMLHFTDSAVTILYIAATAAASASWRQLPLQERVMQNLDRISSSTLCTRSSGHRISNDEELYLRDIRFHCRLGYWPPCLNPLVIKTSSS